MNIYLGVILGQNLVRVAQLNAWMKNVQSVFWLFLLQVKGFDS